MNGFQHLGQALGTVAHLLVTDPVPPAVRIALALLLVTAGGYKLRHPLIAATAMVNFGIVGRVSKTAGYGLGVAECASAVALVLPWSRAGLLAGCLAAGALSMGFAFVIARALLAHQSFPCHCLPGTADQISGLTLARAVAMVIAAIVATAAVLTGAPAIPGLSDAIAATGLAAASLGLPVCVHAAATVWRNYRRFVAQTDWEWVVGTRDGHVVSPAAVERQELI